MFSLSTQAKEFAMTANYAWGRSLSRVFREWFASGQVHARRLQWRTAV